jgi:hypothetical protein
MLLGGAQGINVPVPLIQLAGDQRDLFFRHARLS